MKWVGGIWDIMATKKELFWNSAESRNEDIDFENANIGQHRHTRSNRWRWSREHCFRTSFSLSRSMWLKLRTRSLGFGHA